MKKVLISVTNDLVSDQRVHKVAISLQIAGFNVVLIGRKLESSPNLSKRSYETKRLNLFFTKGPLFYFEYNLRLFFFLITNNFDILLSNDLDTLLANFLAGKIKNKPLVYDSHEYFTEVPELIGREVAKSVWETIERFILPKVKYSYTVCNSIADIYNRKYNINMKVVRNIPLCEERSIENTALLREKKIIIYQGAVNKGRGIDSVIMAMHHVNNAEFWIIGSGDEFDKIKELIRIENLSDKVIMHGKVPFERLFEFTKQASVGISLEENLGLNYYYALPNKLFDYIQAGVPVIGSPLPEIVAIINKYDVGLIAEESNVAQSYSHFIASQLNTMLGNVELREKWAVNLQKAAKELCWENEEKILLEIFNSIN